MPDRAYSLASHLRSALSNQYEIYEASVSNDQDVNVKLGGFERLVIRIGIGVMLMR